MKRAWRYLLAGFNRRSLLVAVPLLAVYVFAATTRWGRIGPQLDFLLVGLWVYMTSTMCWDVRWDKDISLGFAGMVGGFVIEWWGTNTDIWWYRTAARPPLWILVAWPVSAMATDRLSSVVGSAVGDRRLPWKVLYYALVPAFVAAMTWFIRHTLAIPATMVVIGIMLTVLALGRTHRRDVLLFVCGSCLGVFLEYWGTSHRCWTYYTREMPPPIAIFAHGFATVAFARGLDILQWLLKKAGLPWSVLPRTESS